MTRPGLLYFIFSLLVILFSTSFLSLNAQQDSDAIDDPTSKTRPTVGLVLAGGGAKGFTYIGLLKMIHEAELPIDYIGGTSIGSIIGGLYAAGYHPDSIEKMVRSIDWNALLTDQIERKYVAFEEKEFAERFIITLPIKEKSVTISPSLYKGQEINLMLNHYFSPFFLTDDFNDLSTPFVCIATDLLTGDEVELRSGYLPMAIRASMSIPGYFSPIDYQGLYLVDGGVINNFPVKNVKAMGADIIVSGDDQPPLRSTREEFTSLAGVLDQIIIFHRTETNRIGRELSDIYIPLDTKYGILDFARFDSIIAFGERTSKPFYDQLKALADSLNEIEYKPMKEFITKPLDEIKIHDVRIKGYDQMSEAYFENYFNFDKDTLLSLEDIERNIRLMYGSRFFEQVNYEISANDGKNILIIEVNEADPGYLSAGIHYDGD
ncbi:MAG: patatin-like phospholipase family protein, partial [Bacteroidales bacterium]|nr:patatin-like phospholipase family protein [Bacteroidales bacterium]